MNNNLLKHQSGYALILVLLTITVICILAPTLIFSVLNSAKQQHITEQKIQKDKLIDMGKMFARNSIIKEVNSLPVDDINNAIIKLSTEIESYDLSIDLNGTNYDATFEINYGQLNFNQDNKTLNIPYTITGKLLTKRPEAAIIGDPIVGNETFTLQLSEGGSGGGGNGGAFIDWNNITPSDFADPAKFPNQYQKQHFRGTITGNTNFSGEVQIQPTDTLTVKGSSVLQDGAHLSNSGSLFIEGNFYSTGGKLFLNQNSKIIIDKNAWFKGVQIQFPTSSTICVKGRIREWNVSGQGANRPPNPQQVSSCNNVSGGIFYVGEFYPDTEGSESSDGDWKVIGSS